jgi:hypothetical protein
MEYEDEEDLFHPISVTRKFSLTCIALQHTFENEGATKHTFIELSSLPNAKLKGELLRVYALGLFASDKSPSFLVSSLFFQSW